MKLGIATVIGIVLSVAANAKVLTPSQIADSLNDSLVQVEYQLQFDNGRPPQIGASGKHEPINEDTSFEGGGAEFVAQERPLLTGGYLVDNDIVLATDVVIHPRFVKSIQVRFGDQVVDAVPDKYAVEQKAVFLKLSKPLAHAKPLRFVSSGKEPYWDVRYTHADGQWITEVGKFAPNYIHIQGGSEFNCTSPNCLVVDGGGHPLAAVMSEELAIDESWKVPPTRWKTITHDEMKAKLEKLEAAADKSILRVQISFRSPKATTGPTRHYHGMGGEESDSATELNTAGIMIDSNTILILANLKPKVTARLEQIQVYTDDVNSVKAKFSGSLTDYGCFTAVLEKPMAGTIQWSQEPTTNFRNRLVLSAEVLIQGEKRVVYTGHQQIDSFEQRFRGQVYPEVSGDAKSMFLFDMDGRLLAFPLAHREKFEDEENNCGRNDAQYPAAAVSIRPAVTQLAANTDPANVPLGENQENRLAWLGVELQALNEELARVNNVSHLTNDGQTGALVSYVYPDSPAAKAGIEPGCILLRLHVPTSPKPIEIDMRNSSNPFEDEGFPWERLGELPEQYFDRIPTPWPSAENMLTRTISDIGFGKKFTAEFFINGKTVMKEFTVVESPAHYDSAPRYKSESLGLTISNITYELQRYFQRSAIEPGVVISKIEPGSKASVAGIKPYEIITHVNDEPVTSVADFEKLTTGKDQLKLSVKRMNKGRLVNLTLAPAKKETPKEPEVKVVKTAAEPNSVK